MAAGAGSVPGRRRRHGPLPGQRAVSSFYSLLQSILMEAAEPTPGPNVPKSTKVWHYANIYPTAAIGENCSIGSFAEIGNNVRIGNGVRIGAFAYIPEGVTIEDGAFIAPHVVFTNDKRPPSPKEVWLPTLVKRGASIGSNSTIICGVTIGEKAMVGAGSVVTRDVPAGALVYGNPARPADRAAGQE
jgi:UDP-2-acetamido-3-amino-2,3-dideoxy-glucuronate N-acetyltransferase